MVPSPVIELEGLAPLLYSFTRSQGLIRAFKEHGGRDLRRILFRMPVSLRNQLLETHFFAVVPIPQERNRSYVRGHESAREVARFFADSLGVPVLPLLELKSARVDRLTGLRKFEREWAENPFQISNQTFCSFQNALFRERMAHQKEMRLLLVDDLITSGSTLAKASFALTEFYPGLRVWGGSLGFRPHRIVH